jgi:hypothetical protein
MGDDNDEVTRSTPTHGATPDQGGAKALWKGATGG